MTRSILLATALSLFSPLAMAAPEPIAPDSVAVIFNSAQADSRSLALYYAARRKIPQENLVGLELAETEVISRDDFNRTLRGPLARRFKGKKWAGKIKVLVCMRGVPVKISRVPVPPPEGSTNPPKKGPHIKQDEAAVDSELTLLNAESIPIEGPIRNPYFKSDRNLGEASLQGMLLVGRIDGASPDTCKRMIKDAVEAEAGGLWGMCYLDLALKGVNYQMGDDWINGVAEKNAETGIPTVIDRNRDTFVTNYPMSDAALYYGWYVTNRNGPLLNPEFSFRKGAVAVHLHSFSASHLRQSTKYWCGPILEKGAAATLGNVYEPFLQFTHQFDVFHDRLLKGYSLVEAAYMSIPVVSWQAVVLGDPLYRPYAAFTDFADFKTGEPGWEYKAHRQAYIEWGNLPETRVTKLRSVAARHKSGLLYEALGLFYLQEDKPDLAGAFFTSAMKNYQQPSDRLRQELHLVDLARRAERKQDAIARLRTIKEDYADIPEAKAITGLLNILDPPPPPPAKIQPPSKPKSKS